MKIKYLDPPREFIVGNTDSAITMKDCARIFLKEDEQVTFITEDNMEYDLAKKSWGYYATPSLNGRLQEFGLRALLIKNVITSRYFIFLLEKNKENELEQYMNQENLEIICWLDNTHKLNSLEKVLKSNE